MKAKLIDGKTISAELRAQMKKEVAALAEDGITPGLAVVIVGDDPASKVYVRNKKKACEELGIYSEEYALPAETTQDELLALIRELNAKPDIDGILVQLPLPKQLDMEEIKFIVDPVKDIDCMNPLNAEKIFEGDKTGYPPCTSQACIEILDHYGVDMKGKRAAVVGRSMVVGKPLAMLLLDKNATVTICHSRTNDLPAVCRQAEVVIAAVGRAEMVKGDFISDGAVVIDVGINVNEEGKLCGDVKFDECVDKASMITPVPAGVGSVTTSVLAKHVVKACKQINHIQ